MDPSPPFCYKPLDQVKSEIRVIRIPPKDDDNFRLETVCLDDSPAFVALSYVWGDPNIKELISLDNQPFPVTKNLAAALKQIRNKWTLEDSPHRVESLWVDAICINQRKPDERTQQVQLMGRIYKSAAVVLAWLGPSDHSLAFSSITLLAREMADNTGRKKLNEEKLSRPHYLSPNVWWALTTQLVGVDLVHQPFVAKETINNKPILPKAVQHGWVMSRYAANLRATDPKDYIYGLLAITELPIIPDYNKSLSDVYIEYTAAWLETCRDMRINENMTSLTFLSNAGIGIYGPKDDFPSWVSNFPGQEKPDISSTKMGTGRADRGVFGDDSSKLPFVIARTKSLFAWGFEVETVRSVAEGPVYRSTDSWDLLQSALTAMSRGKRYKTGLSTLNAFFRLLHRKRSRVASKSTIIRDLCLFCHTIMPSERVEPQQRDDGLLRLGFSTDPVELEAQLADCFAPGADIRQLGFDKNLRDMVMEWPRGTVGDAWQRIRLTLIKLEKTWRLVDTTSGYLGLAPRGTIVGDRLCVLKGSDVPVLLRRTDLDSYIVVGTTFVEGLMDGEAAELEQAGKGMGKWFQMQ
ncbi:hypothetical protein BHE90_002270 [Fusarium euwallaceae]|uniref:Heterokaryon incompatibility domain-containing protein n=1 Tax=Fusarium euwallaceae TaxID=1147111 RepID=A0A430M5B3_9HYPO|nr:hypothetical protein BHE90_002270 [Fusarium euwallaceae]